MRSREALYFIRLNLETGSRGLYQHTRRLLSEGSERHDYGLV